MPSIRSPLISLYLILPHTPINSTEISKIERELTSSKVDRYFMRSRGEGFREEPAGAHARHSSK